EVVAAVATPALELGLEAVVEVLPQHGVGLAPLVGERAPIREHPQRGGAAASAAAGGVHAAVAELRQLVAVAPHVVVADQRAEVDGGIEDVLDLSDGAAVERAVAQLAVGAEGELLHASADRT